MPSRRGCKIRKVPYSARKTNSSTSGMSRLQRHAQCCGGHSPGRKYEGTHVLKTNAGEAGTVRAIFEKYLELASVNALGDWLQREGITPKRWTTKSGKQMGAAKFSRGALFHLLRNPIYRGMIRHKGVLHEGAHDAIVDAKTFERVQLRLDHAANRWRKARNPVARAPLAARIFDAAGEPMSPSFAHGKRGQVYRYYVSSSLQKGGAPANNPDIIQRVPGAALECQLADNLKRLLPDSEENILTLPKRVEIHRHAIHVLLEAHTCIGIDARLEEGEKAALDSAKPDWVRLELPLRVRHSRGRTAVQVSKTVPARYDQVLVDGLRRAHAMVELDRKRLPTLANAPDTMYERRLVRLAFLAPELQSAILEGRQPAHLSLEQLIERPLPIDWSAQRALFEKPHAHSKPRHRCAAAPASAP